MRWKTLFVAGGMVAVGAVTGCAQPSTKSSMERTTVNGLPSVTSTETTKADLKVEAIDYESRSIALTGPRGDTEIFTAGPQVRNFAQIKKGDVVKAEIYTRVGASVHKVNEEPQTRTVTTVAPSQAGDKPGILCVRQSRIEANVEAINYQTREVTLKTGSGNEIRLVADKQLKNLDKVRAGDQVVFDCTEAVTLQVQ